MVVCTMRTEQCMGKLNGSCNPQQQSTKSKQQQQQQVQDDDREEGEIVDDFEMIISSEDEEFKLRARIKQLEDENKDMEKISVLSANLSNQYSYQQQKSKAFPKYPQYPNFQPIHVPPDGSDKSDEEFSVPKKYHKHKVKRMESKRRKYLVDSNNYRRKPLAKRPLAIRKKHRHHHYDHQTNQPHHQPQSLTDNTMLDSLESVSDDEIGEYDLNVDVDDDDDDDDDADDEDLERLKLNRDKLRAALARNGNRDIMPKHSLKERLQGRLRQTSNSLFCPTPSLVDVNPQQQQQEQQQEEDEEEEFNVLSQSSEDDLENRSNEPGTHSPAELKLRLIALKSVILKKHYARKKRDAERAYSPTDMINCVHPAINNDCDIDDLMEISPAISPERVISPQDFDDTKSVDMDLAETDSDEGANNNNHNLWPTNDCWRRLSGSNSLPPVTLPIVIDDDDDDDDEDEVPPPPPPFTIHHIPPFQSIPGHANANDDDDARDAHSLHMLTCNDHSNQDSITTDIQTIEMENAMQNSQENLTRTQLIVEVSEDEDEIALRQLLLSKLKSTTTRTNVNTMKLKETEKATLVTQKNSINSTNERTNEFESDDPEELRSQLLSSIANKKMSDVSPTILKKAVRRIQANLTADCDSNCDSPDAFCSGSEAKLELETTTKDWESISVAVSEKSSSSSASATTKDSPNAELVVNEVVEQQTATAVLLPVPLPVPAPTTTTTPAPAIVQLPSVPPVIKIVKPNKVINKNTTTIKRKIPISDSFSTSVSPKRPATLLVKEASAPLHTKSVAPSTTRTITKFDPTSIKVNKLIINLNECCSSSADSGDEELEMEHMKSCMEFHSYSVDNASPLSMAMDSGSNSTTRSNTPNSEIIDATTTTATTTSTSTAACLRRTVINDYFEKKIDDFLKNARSKAAVVPTAGGSKKPTQQPEEIAPKESKIVVAKTTQQQTTSVAVKHLPVASQKEYLRLVERMRILEEKRTEITKTQTETSTKSPSVNDAISKKCSSSSSMPITASKPTTTATKTSKMMMMKEKPSPVSVRRSGTEQPSTSSAAAATTTATATMAAKLQPSKESRLKAFENSFLKIGASMLTNLDKSLQLVEEAKASKITRLRCAQRLKELTAEMLAMKQADKLEQLKLARIQPEIHASHEIIISLKQKRSKLYNAAMDLGRGLIGTDYRLADDGKQEIVRKSSQLTKKIRLYNSISKFEDVKALIDSPASTPTPTATQTATTTPNPVEQRPPASVAVASPASVAVALPASVAVASPASVAIASPVSVVVAPPASIPEEVNEVSTNSAIDHETETKKISNSDVTAEDAFDVLATKDDSTQSAPSSVPCAVSDDISPQDQTATEQRNYANVFMRELTTAPVTTALLANEYQTPLSWNSNSQLDIYGTMCPFELMGRCEDADCSYIHLPIPSPP